MQEKLYVKIASAVDARLTCERTGNLEWFKRWTETIRGYVSDYLPRGLGFDSGTELDFSKSTGEKLVFSTSFHHMNEGGYYDGWTEHTVTVWPSLLFGFTLSISGRDRDEWKEYAYQVFQDMLSTVLADAQEGSEE